MGHGSGGLGVRGSGGLGSGGQGGSGVWGVMRAVSGVARRTAGS